MSSTTDVYDNIFEAIRVIEPNHVILQGDAETGGLVRHLNLMYMDMGDGTIGAFSNNLSSRYYRGECGLYEHCYSSIDRIGNVDKIIWQIKAQDFILLLKRNTEIQRAIQNHEYIEFTALAQHYGFPTNMLDVTNDLLIAAYFAVHEVNPITGVWELKTNGFGRIRCSTEFAKPTGRLTYIGLQVLGRPAAQSAYGIYLREGEDYADSSYCIEFRQDITANKKFHQILLGGPQMIYPNENVNVLVRRIKNSACVTAEAVALFCGEYEKSKEEVVKILEEQNIAVVNAPVADWCLIQDAINSMPSFKRNSVLRPAFIIG